MITVLIPFLVFVVGLLIFTTAKANPDIKEIGRCLMWCGALVTLLVVAQQRIHF